MTSHEPKQGSSQQSPHMNSSKKMSKGTIQSFWIAAVLLVFALALFGFLMMESRREDSLVKTSDSQLGVDNAPRQELARQNMDTKMLPGDSKDLSSQDAAFVSKEAMAPDKKRIASESSSASSSEPPLNSQDEADIHKALEFLDQGNFAEASQLLEGVLKRDPSNERALLEMAMMQLLDLKQPEQAVKYLQRAYEVNPANPMVMNELASLFEEQGRLDEGIQFFSEQAQKKGQSSSARDAAYGAGQMLMIAGRDQEALPFLQKAVDGGQGNTRALVDLAETYSRLGDHEKSIDAYQKSINAQQAEITQQQSKGIPMQYGAERIGYTKMQLVREYLKAGQKDEAQALMEEVKQLLPGDDSVTALQKQIAETQGAAKG